jgi:transcriptional regulator with PAS, ATPase and Fis domain
LPALSDPKFVNKGHYVDINCAAIPENLIERLLFGTAKGEIKAL